MPEIIQLKKTINLKKIKSYLILLYVPEITPSLKKTIKFKEIKSYLIILYLEPIEIIPWKKKIPKFQNSFYTPVILEWFELITIWLQNRR